MRPLVGLRLPGATRSGRTRLAVAALAVAALGVSAAACGPAQPTTSPAPSGSGLAPLAASPGATATPSTANSPSPPAIASPPASPAGVTVDPGLLEVLPAKVDGVSLQPDPTTAAQVAGDHLLAGSAISIAVALAVGTGASASDDLAVASVIRLRPDVFDEAFFQEWRDTYDEAACEVADGVASDTETEIGGRTAYVGTCVGGAQTYHVYLEDQVFIVSITASGARRFGELILAGLAG